MTDENPARDAAYLLIAKGQADDLKAYLDRGRGFEKDPTDVLTELLVVALEQWIADISNYANRTIVSDIFSEFAIRDLEPDHERVGPLVDQLAARVEQALSTVTDERKEEAAEEFLRDYEAIVRSRN